MDAKRENVTSGCQAGERNGRMPNGRTERADTKRENGTSEFQTRERNERMPRENETSELAEVKRNRAKQIGENERNGTERKRIGENEQNCQLFTDGNFFLM